MRRFTVLVFLIFVLPFGLFGQTSSTSADFDQLVDETFDAIYKFNPSNGTADGFHQYDTRLEDFSQASIASEIASSNAFFSLVESKASRADAARARNNFSCVEAAVVRVAAMI